MGDTSVVLLIPRTRQEVGNNILWPRLIFDLCEFVICQEFTQPQDALRGCLLSEQIFEAIVMRKHLKGHLQEDCVPCGRGREERDVFPSPLDWLSVSPLSVELVRHKQQPLLSNYLSSSGRDSRPPKNRVSILFPRIPVLSPRLSFPDKLPFPTE